MQMQLVSSMSYLWGLVDGQLHSSAFNLECYSNSPISHALPRKRRNAYRDKSVTIQVAPIPSSCSLVWDVQTAKTLAPLATPDLIPEGASSTTMPRVF